MVGVALLMVLFFLAVIAGWIWAIVDAARRPDWAYEQAGTTKALWVVLIVVLGLIGIGIYLAATRPGLVRAEAGGPPGYAPMFVPPCASPPAAAGTGALRFCPHCGHPREVTARFCAGCGGVLG